MRTAISATGILGAGIGVANAAYAIAVVGGESAYQGRLAFGAAALLLAAITGIVALLPVQPVVAAVTFLLGGALGFAAINLFYINTFYFAALPFWLAGAVVALVIALRPQPA